MALPSSSGALSVKGGLTFLIQILLTLAVATPVLARSPLLPERVSAPQTATILYTGSVHKGGRVGLTVGNSGTFGNGLLSGGRGDYFTGEFLPSCQYPSDGYASYLFGATLWIGAVVGSDTLVSTALDPQGGGGREFHPSSDSLPPMTYRSTTDKTSPAYAWAVSEHDLISVYYDTCRTCFGLGLDPVDARPHLPLGLVVKEESYSWSYGVAEDFVLFSYLLTNIGDNHLTSLYFGLYLDADVQLMNDGSTGHGNDLSGFLRVAANSWLPESCRDSTKLDLAWSADVDGALLNSSSQPRLPAVLGIMPLEEPGKAKQVSFNWWFRPIFGDSDWGPQARASFRMMDGNILGSPIGDRDKYHLLSNGEQDYDQARTATVSGEDSVWLPPPLLAPLIASGMDTRFIWSVGPYDLSPGEALEVPLALVLGDKLHSTWDNDANLPYDPDEYYRNLDFSDLAHNAQAARYVYDNPGVDTDGDGYAGKYRLCGEDTVWFEGDGVADWTVVRPPPSPEVRLESTDSSLLVRWNGLESESYHRTFSGEAAFEGYAVYLGLENSVAALAMVARYDIEDYRRYVWDSTLSDWRLLEYQLDLEEAVCRYGPHGCSDRNWHPVDFTRQNPWVMPDNRDSVLYFEPVDVNSSIFGLETPISRTYPQAERPDYSSPDQVPADSVQFYLTAEGNFRYYEYQLEIDALIPGQTYWVGVTAFDFGSKLTQADPVESDPLDNLVLFSFPDRAAACCESRTGNVNGDAADSVTLGDVAMLVDHLFLSRSPVACVAEADVDRSGGLNPNESSLNLADLIMLVDHLFVEGDPLPACGSASK